MKKIIFTLLFMVFALALGTSFAMDDQMPTLTDRKDIGTELYLDSLKPHEIMSRVPAIKDFGRRGPIVSEARVDVGTALYNEVFSKESIMLETRGAAAGGMTGEDENTRIWNNYFNAP
jgi:hypothetical protein